MAFTITQSSNSKLQGGFTTVQHSYTALQNKKPSHIIPVLHSMRDSTTTQRSYVMLQRYKHWKFLHHTIRRSTRPPNCIHHTILLLSDITSLKILHDNPIFLHKITHGIHKHSKNTSKRIHNDSVLCKESKGSTAQCGILAQDIQALMIPAKLQIKDMQSLSNPAQHRKNVTQLLGTLHTTFKQPQRHPKSWTGCHGIRTPSS